MSLPTLISLVRNEEVSGITSRERNCWIHVQRSARVGQIEVQICPVRVSQLGFCCGSVLVVVARVVYGDTVQVPPRYLASFRLHPTGSRGFRLVVDDPLVEGHACDVCFRLLDLQHGHRRSEPSGSVRTSRMLASPSPLQGIGMCCLPSCWNQAGLPESKERVCSRVTWRSRALLED